jgi:hypothetical protein
VGDARQSVTGDLFSALRLFGGYALLSWFLRQQRVFEFVRTNTWKAVPIKKTQSEPCIFTNVSNYRIVDSVMWRIGELENHEHQLSQRQENNEDDANSLLPVPSESFGRAAPYCD